MATPAAVPPPGPVGSYATTLLRPVPATSITVEVLAQSGAAPRSATVDHVVRVLGEVSAKPVTASPVEPLPGAARDWSAEDLAALADAASRQPRRADRAVLHLLYVHGTLGGDGSVLGVSVRGDVAVVLADQVAAAEPPLFASGAIEDAVTMHEVGHLLGLVDLVLSTGRADPQHPGHSTDQASVMYWAVESSLLGRILQGGPPRDFDDQDRADLAAIRSGAGGPG